MATPKWLKGQTLSLTIDEEEYNCNISAAKITAEESDDDFVTFCPNASGASYDYHLTATIGQSLESTSLWSYIFDHEGEEVPYVFAPAGNEEPTLSEPHFTGSVKIGKMPDLGGEASKTGSVWTSEIDWLCTAKPTKVTTA